MKTQFKRSFFFLFFLLSCLTQIQAISFTLDEVYNTTGGIQRVWAPGQPTMAIPQSASYGNFSIYVRVNQDLATEGGRFLDVYMNVSVDGGVINYTDRYVGPLTTSSSYNDFDWGFLNVNLNYNAQRSVSIQLYVKDENNDVIFISTETFTYNVIDPNAIDNNIICFTNNFSSCTSVLTVTNTLNAQTIYGSTPIKGGTGGGAPVGGYTYQWEMKVDNSPWQQIAGATSQNYNFPGTITPFDIILFRRKVSTVNYPTGSYSTEATLSFQICNTPPYGSHTLCTDQYFYNVTPGTTVQPRKIIGSREKLDPRGFLVLGGRGELSFEVSTDQTNWVKKVTYEYRRNDSASTVNVKFEYTSPALTKAWWPETDVYYVRRTLRTKRCWIFCEAWQEDETTNTVKIVVSQCADPRINNFATITGPSTITCPQTSLTYNATANVNCGILKYEWALPEGWSFDSPSSGANAK